MTGQLNFVITANNKAALAALNTTNAALSNTSTIAQITGAQIAKGSKQAGQSLINLGRIAQDAPYGFIGIQNNLNPMLESFERLKEETGSTGAALKAMAAGLMGPAGIGVALSVASALFLTFGDSLLKSSEATKKAAEAHAHYVDTLSSGIGTAMAEITTIETLVSIVNDHTKSIGERKRALDEIKGSYEGNLELQATDIDDKARLTKVIDALSAAILRKARVEAFSKIIAEEEAKNAKIQMENDDQRIKRIDVVKQGIKEYISGFMGLISPTTANIVNNKLMVDGLIEAGKEFDFNTRALGKLKSMLKVTKEEQIKFNDANTLGGKKSKNGKEKVKVEKIANYKSVGGRLGLMVGTDKQSTLDTENVKLQKGQAYLDIQAQTIVNDDIRNAQLEEANQLANMGTQAFATMFDALLQGGNVFDALGNSVKRLIVDLAAAVVKAVLFKAIMSFLNPASAAVPVPGFAIGGVASGPKSGHLAMLHGTEAVLTPHQMTGIINQSMNAGAMQGMQSSGGEGGGSFTLRGNDLVLALQRSNTSLNLRRG